MAGGRNPARGQRHIRHLRPRKPAHVQARQQRAAEQRTRILKRHAARAAVQARRQTATAKERERSLRRTSSRHGGTDIAQLPVRAPPVPPQAHACNACSPALTPRRRAGAPDGGGD